jgi:hypothetical protein
MTEPQYLVRSAEHLDNLAEERNAWDAETEGGRWNDTGYDGHTTDDLVTILVQEVARMRKEIDTLRLRLKCMEEGDAGPR